MGINVKVQKSPKPSEIIVAQASLERDLRECMKCKFFYGNKSQCLAKKVCERRCNAQSYRAGAGIYVFRLSLSTVRILLFSMYEEAART